MAEWNREVTLRFIKEYENRKLLWDANHPDHNDNNLKRKAWAEIADILKKNPGAIKSKLTRMTETFLKEMEKIWKVHGEEGLKQSNISTWYPFDSMKFLMEHVKPKPIPVTEPVIQEVKQEEDSCDIDSSQEDLSLSTEGPSNSGSLLHNMFQENKIGSHTSNTSSAGQGNNSKKRRITEDLSDEEDEYNDNNEDQTQTHNGYNGSLAPKRQKETRGRDDLLAKAIETLRTVKYDECEAFGIHVTNQVRNFTGKARASLIHAINEVLYKAHVEVQTNNLNEDTKPILIPEQFNACTQTKAGTSGTSSQKPFTLLHVNGK